MKSSATFRAKTVASFAKVAEVGALETSRQVTAGRDKTPLKALQLPLKDSHIFVSAQGFLSHRDT
jgi:hypothetical protein